MNTDRHARLTVLLRYLRVAFSAVCGILCLLLILLWVRSYWRTDEISQWRDDGFTKIKVLWGEIEIENNPYLTSDGQVRWKLDSKQVRHEANPYLTTLGFAWENDSDESTVVIPCWFLMAITILVGSIAAAPHIGWRFSLRTLLIAMTVIAVVLGVIVALTR